MLLKGNHFCLITNKNISRLYRLSVFLVESISDIGTCKKNHIGTPLHITAFFGPGMCLCVCVREGIGRG